MTTRVGREHRIEIGGKGVAGVEVTSITRMKTGVSSKERHRTFVYAPALGLVVYDVIDLTVDIRGEKGTRHDEWKLLSLDRN